MVRETGMRHWLYRSALALVALTAAAPGAFAFTPAPSDGSFDNTLNTKIQDPEDIMADIQNRPVAGSSMSLGKYGSFSLQMVGPYGGAINADGPFLRDPAANTVPSKREGW
jgi:hypothetical protein